MTLPVAPADAVRVESVVDAWFDSSVSVAANEPGAEVVLVVPVVVPGNPASWSKRSASSVLDALLVDCVVLPVCCSINMARRSLLRLVLLPVNPAAVLADALAGVPLVVAVVEVGDETLVVDASCCCCSSCCCATELLLTDKDIDPLLLHAEPPAYRDQAGDLLIAKIMPAVRPGKGLNSLRIVGSGCLISALFAEKSCRPPAQKQCVDSDPSVSLRQSLSSGLLVCSSYDAVKSK